MTLFCMCHNWSVFFLPPGDPLATLDSLLDEMEAGGEEVAEGVLHSSRAVGVWLPVPSPALGLALPCWSLLQVPQGWGGAGCQVSDGFGVGRCTQEGGWGGSGVGKNIFKGFFKWQAKWYAS